MKGEKMSYGQVAVGAVIEFQNQQHQNLLQAWYQALKLNNVSDKLHPKKHPFHNKTKSSRNKEYYYEYKSASSSDTK
jgi:hypothetical protein